MPEQDIQDALLRAIRQFPFIAPLNLNVQAQSGQPYYSEYYPPWESQNPQPGRHTIGIRNPEFPLSDMITAESLHALGSVDPRTQEPVSPAWRSLKDLWRFSPQQHAMNQRAYQSAQLQGESRPFPQWMDQSRLDQFIGAGMFPQMSPQWSNVQWTPQQVSLLAILSQLLTQSPRPLGP